MPASSKPVASSQPAQTRTLFVRLLPFFIFLALVCVFLGPVLFGGRVLLPGGLIGKMAPWHLEESKPVYWNVLAWDSCAEYYPARTLLGRSLRSGEIPLWNPYQFSGYPFLADMLSAVLYPPNLLYAVLPSDRALGILAALHLLMAGVFMYIFLRGLKLSRTASTVGGITFMLSGFSVAWLELPVFLSVGVWLPLTLHLSRLAHERKSVGYAIGAGLSIAMSLLGGHPQIAFYALLAVVLYWVYLSIFSRVPDGTVGKHPFLTTALLACLALFVGAALAAPQVLPMMELASLSHRGVQPPTAAGYAAYTRLAMPISHLITLFVPDFFGNPSKGTYWGYNEYTEYCAYVGVLPLLLIPLAFMRRKRRTAGTKTPGSNSEVEPGNNCQSAFFAVLGIFALLMALGSPLNAIFYYCVPGFTKAGSPARILYLVVFSFTTLAAIGMDRLFRPLPAQNSDRAIKWILFSGLGALIICTLLFVVNLMRLAGQVSIADLLQGQSQEIRMFAVFFLAAVVIPVLFLKGTVSRQLAITLLVGILAADLISFGMYYNATCTPAEAYGPTELTNSLKQKTDDYSRIMALNDKWSLRKIPEAVLPPNSAMMYGLLDVSGYDSLYPRRYKALLDAAAGGESCPPENGNMVFARNPNSPVYDLLGMKYIVSRNPIPGARKIGDCYVRENPNALHRTFVVHSFQSGTDADILDRIAKGKTDLRETALIADEDTPWLRESPMVKSGGEDVAQITRLTCNTVEVNASTNSDGLLILTDQYYPGWAAYVDGYPTRVLRADYDVRGVPIPAGKHTVLFRYEPKPYKKGLILAFFALAVIAILSVRSIIRTKLRHTAKS